MKLAEARDGDVMQVLAVEGDASLQALRFGIGAGSVITVEKNISGGPVIVSRNQIEIALGREVAKAIQVVARKGNDG